MFPVCYDPTNELARGLWHVQGQQPWPQCVGASCGCAEILLLDCLVDAGLNFRERTSEYLTHLTQASGADGSPMPSSNQKAGIAGRGSSQFRYEFLPQPEVPTSTY